MVLGIAFGSRWCVTSVISPKSQLSLSAAVQLPKQYLLNLLLCTHGLEIVWEALQLFTCC